MVDEPMELSDNPSRADRMRASVARLKRVYEEFQAQQAELAAVHSSRGESDATDEQLLKEIGHGMSVVPLIDLSLRHMSAQVSNSWGVSASTTRIVGQTALNTVFTHVRTSLLWPQSVNDFPSRTDDVAKLEYQQDEIQETLKTIRGMETDLRRDWARAQKRINHLVPTHPISQLPPELLSLVFQCFDQLEQRTIDSARFCRPQLPVIISHVCSHWRDVALATPSLWDNVIACSGYRGLRQLRTLLPRSGILPLTLRLFSSDGGDLVDDFAAEIIPHLGRLVELQLEGYTARFMTLITLLAQASVPDQTYTLRNVDLILAWSNTEPPTIIPIHNGAFFNALRCMHLSHISWESPETCPVRELKISIRRSSSNGWDPVFKPIWNGLANLQCLDVTILSELDAYNNPHRFNLPQLSTLKLRAEDSHLPGIFAVLDAPRLTSVELEIFLGETTLEHYTFLSEFAARSSPIRKLKITKSVTHESSERIIEMISLTPSIEELTITGIARDKLNRDALAGLPDALRGLPNLKTLRLLKGCFQYASLKRMLTEGVRNRVALHLGPGFIFLPEVLEDHWPGLKEAMKNEIQQYADLKYWGLVLENAQDAPYEWH